MSDATSEFRKLMTWMRLFVLGAFVALSAAMSLAVGGEGPRLAAVLVGTGSLLAVISWQKLGPLLRDNSAVEASEAMQGRPA